MQSLSFAASRVSTACESALRSQRLWGGFRSPSPKLQQFRVHSFVPSKSSTNHSSKLYIASSTLEDALPLATNASNRRPNHILRKINLRNRTLPRLPRARRRTSRLPQARRNRRQRPRRHRVSFSRFADKNAFPRYSFSMLMELWWGWYRFIERYAPTVETKCLFRFDEPVSPHLAASRSTQVAPDDDQLLNQVAHHVRDLTTAGLRRSSDSRNVLYIESAGGELPFVLAVSRNV